MAGFIVLLVYGLLGFFGNRRLDRLSAASKPPSFVFKQTKDCEILPMNSAELWENGTPEGVSMFNIRLSKKILEITALDTGVFQVSICDPDSDTKQVLSSEATWVECEKVTDNAGRGWIV